jgi:Mrp family chromosome partitioning ATPase
MWPQRRETIAVPAPAPSQSETPAGSMRMESGAAHPDGWQLSELLASRVVRHALQPVADRLLTLPGGVFCVASAEADEGRTLVATALSLMLSEKTDKNVLLVDAHVQRPCVHHLFGVPRMPGLTECLLEERGLQDAVSLVGTLSVLPAGRDDGRPRLFRTATAKRLLEEMGRTYDFALIDLPPLAPVASEATAFCDWSDGTLLVVRANATKASAVGDAVKMIDSHKVLGVVLNQEQNDMPRWLQRLF